MSVIKRTVLRFSPGFIRSSPRFSRFSLNLYDYPHVLNFGFTHWNSYASVNILETRKGAANVIRTINGAIEELRKDDPETPINSHMLRRWIASGELKHTKSGNRYLIDMDVLKEFLRGK